MDVVGSSEGPIGSDRSRAVRRIRTRYHQTLDVALHLFPDGPPLPRRHTGGWTTAQRDAWNLATRMRRDADQVLRLLDDTRVPCNNQADRDLRMIKIHDKISGCFRNLTNAEAYTTTRSYLHTVANTTRTGSTSSDSSSPPAPGSHPNQPAPEQLQYDIPVLMVFSDCSAKGNLNARLRP